MITLKRILSFLISVSLLAVTFSVPVFAEDVVYNSQFSEDYDEGFDDDTVTGGVQKWNWISPSSIDNLTIDSSNASGIGSFLKFKAGNVSGYKCAYMEMPEYLKNSSDKAKLTFNLRMNPTGNSDNFNEFILFGGGALPTDSEYNGQNYIFKLTQSGTDKEVYINGNAIKTSGHDGSKWVAVNAELDFGAKTAMLTMKQTTNPSNVYYSGTVSMGSDAASLGCLAFICGNYNGGDSAGYIGLDALNIYSVIEQEVYETYYSGTVTFSQAAGIYPSAVDISMSTDLEGGKIYYTTDGSDPDPSSPSSTLYTEGQAVNISRTSKNSTYVSRATVNAGTVVKAAAFGGTAVVTDPITLEEKTVAAQTPVSVSTYFIGEDFLSRYPNAKIISLSTPWENINNSSNFSIWKNFSASGAAWERRGFMEVFDTNGEKKISQSVGIRINGGATRSYDQKSLRIYSRTNEKYDEKGVPGTTNFAESAKNFKYDFFDGAVKDNSGAAISKYKSIILRNNGNEWKTTYIRDRFAQAAVGMLDFDTQGYTPCVAFMNGEYIGTYGLRERLDDNYFENHYNLSDSSDVAIIKISIEGSVKDFLELDEGSEADLADFNNKVEWIINNDMSNPENYAAASEYFDMSNIIDYIAANAFLNSSDWLRNNMVIWKNTNLSGKSGNFDSKWRFAMKDADLTLGTGTGDFINRGLDIYEARIFDENGRDSAHEGTGYLISRLYTSLFESPEFQEEYVRRYNDYLNTIFQNDVLTKRLDEMYNQILPLRSEHRSLWSASWGSTGLSPIKTAIASRISESPNELSKHFSDYAGSKISVSVNNGELSKGYLKVNTLELCEGNKWGITNPETYTAEYYKDVPLKVEAFPKEGFELDYFVVNGEKVFPADGENAISIDLKNKSSLNVSVAFAEDREEKADIISDSVVIYQVYGDGGKTDGPISHSFVQLYNMSESDIDLSGWALRYSNMSGDTWETYRLPDGAKIKAGGYYLISGAPNGAESANLRVNVDADVNFPKLVIDNKTYKIAVTNDSEEINAKGTSLNVVDLLGVYNKAQSEIDAYETAAVTGASKQKSLIRLAGDTGNNSADFMVFAYDKATDEDILKYSPIGAKEKEDPPPRNNISINAGYTVYAVSAENEDGLLSINVEQGDTNPFTLIVTYGGLPIYIKKVDNGSTSPQSYATNLEYKSGYNIYLWNSMNIISPIIYPIISK